MDFVSFGVEPYMNFIPLPADKNALFRVDPDNEIPNVRSIENIITSIIYEDGDDFDRYVVFYKPMYEPWKCYLMDETGKTYKILTIEWEPIYMFPDIISKFRRNLIGILVEVEKDRWRVLS